jgi:hypothetical protein
MFVVCVSWRCLWCVLVGDVCGVCLQDVFMLYTCRICLCCVSAGFVCDVCLLKMFVVCVYVACLQDVLLLCVCGTCFCCVSAGCVCGMCCGGACVFEYCVCLYACQLLGSLGVFVLCVCRDVFMLCV